MNEIIFYPTKHSGYYVSKTGDVYSTATRKCLSPKIDRYGYKAYSLVVNGERVNTTEHRIVAETFLPNPDCKSTVNHKNGDKQDNRIENLEWATVAENNLHRFRVLKYPPSISHGKYNIDVYDKDGIIHEKLCKKQVIAIGFPVNYVNAVQKNKISSYFVYYDADENGIYGYWNGEIVYNFSSYKEAAKALGMKSEFIRQRVLKHKDIEYLAKDYKLIFTNKERCND